MPITMNKKAVGIICNSKELFHSLRRALTLFFPKSSFYLYDTGIIGGQLDILTIQKTNFRSRLRKYHLIIAVAYLETELSKIIRLVHHLRSDLAWEGSFLAVVNSEDEKQWLREASVIETCTEEFPFGELPGHAVICLPFLLTDFVNEIVNLEDMYIEVWDSLVSKSLIVDILEGVNEAEESVRENNINKALLKLREILYKMKEVDWLTWLRDPHEDIPSVNKFIEMYSPERPMDKNDCSTIINNIREILAKSFIRYET